MTRPLIGILVASLFVTAFGGTSFAQVDQFSSPVPAPYTFDRVEGEFINYETQLIHPILVLRSGRVAVVNEPNGSVDIYTAGLSFERSIIVGQGVASIAERVAGPSIAIDEPPTPIDPSPEGENGGLSSSPTTTIAGPISTTDVDLIGPVISPFLQTEIWVTVRHQQAIAVINTSSWRVTHWLRAPIPNNQTGYGAADHPGQVIFNRTNTKAYWPAFNADSLVVFNANTKQHVTTIPLTAVHNNQTSAMNTPFSMARRGDSIYVLSHLSGNQTTAESDSSINTFHGPDRFVIKDLTNEPARSLPDLDLLEVDTTSDTVVDRKTGIGSSNFIVKYHRTADRLVISNVEHRNAEFFGEGSWPDGRVIFSRLTFVDPTGPAAGPHSIVVTEDLDNSTPTPVNVVNPTDIAFRDDRVFVAGYGSRNIGVFDIGGAYLGTIPTSDGPRGLALRGGNLYVYCRVDNRIERFNVGLGLPSAPSASVDLLDPTPETVREGRRHFIDSDNSGFGSSSCMSCHIDGRKEGLGWDLSRFHDSGDSFTPFGPVPEHWKDRKGVMTTQDLRSLPEVAPYHWRGEQHDLEFFNGAFEGLLKGTRLNDDEFALFKSFVFSMRYPPNPEQMLNRNYSDEAEAGLISALNGPSCSNCANCHNMPLGTHNDITIPIQSFALVYNLTPQFRAFWTKESDRCAIDGSSTQRNMTGFGLLHNGINHDSDHFIDLFFGGSTNLKEMLNEFDTGLAPSTVYSELLKGSTVSQSRLNYMVEQANAGYCDIALRGRIAPAGTWINVGGIFDVATQTFTFDDSTLAPLSPSTLLFLANFNRVDVVLLGTPVGSGERLGVDIDRDGVRDTDETNAGSDPRNPDTDGDGQWDGYDLDPINPSAPPTGPVGVSNIQVRYATTNSVKITYETDAPSPTNMVYGLTTSYDREDGDPFPLPLAPNQSKLWKTKHTVFIRAAVRDGAAYNFAIRTQGQNGVTSQTANLTTSTEADSSTLNINPNIRVTDITLIPVTGPPNVIWVANVKVEDNAGNPAAPGTQVRGIFTHFTGGTPAIAVPVTANVGSGGIASLSTSFFGQSSGDATDFTIPQLVDSGGLTVINTSRSLPITPNIPVFMWPESTPTSAKVTIP